jgi:hypothetical protein
MCYGCSQTDSTSEGLVDLSPLNRSYRTDTDAGDFRLKTGQIGVSGCARTTMPIWGIVRIRTWGRCAQQAV